MEYPSISNNRVGIALIGSSLRGFYMGNSNNVGRCSINRRKNQDYK